MKCPECRYKRNDVFDSRKFQTFILRSRRCRRCKNEWKTEEKIIDLDKFKEQSLNNDNNFKKKQANYNLFGGKL